MQEVNNEHTHWVTLGLTALLIFRPYTIWVTLVWQFMCYCESSRVVPKAFALLGCYAV